MEPVGKTPTNPPTESPKPTPTKPASPTPELTPKPEKIEVPSVLDLSVEKYPVKFPSCQECLPTAAH